MKDVHEFKYPYNLLKHLGVINEHDIIMPKSMTANKECLYIGTGMQYVETTRFSEPVYIKVCGDAQDLNASIEYVLHYLEADEYELIKKRYRDIISLKKLAEERGCRVEELDRDIDKALNKLKQLSLIKYLKYGVHGVERQITEEYYEQYKEQSNKIFQMQAVSERLQKSMDTIYNKKESGVCEISPCEILNILKGIDTLDFDENEKIFRINEDRFGIYTSKNIKFLIYDRESRVFRLNKKYFRELYMLFNNIIIPEDLDIEQPLANIELTSYGISMLQRNRIYTIEDVLFFGIENIKTLPKIGEATYAKVVASLTNAGIQVHPVANKEKEQPKQPLMCFYVPPEYMLRKESNIWQLMQLMKKQDKQTYMHSISVASLAYHIAEYIPEVDKDIVYRSGLLHDIGKLFIPHDILYKQNKLNEEEFRIIQKHIEYGIELLMKTPGCAEYIPIIANHHEREDGSGYPNRVSGNKIPIESKIISIADAFDAITGHRIYSQRKTIESALNELKNNSSNQFNNEYVDILIEIMHKNNGGGTAMPAARQD